MKIKLPFLDTKKFPITQLFGEKFMYAGKIVSHKGVDWAMPKFTPLLAPFDGEVVRVEKTREFGYGHAVYIRGTDKKGHNYEALLAHCTNILVDVGVKVITGNRVAYSGNSGFWRGKNGCHLHFGLKVDGHYVDPLPYLKINEVNQVSLLGDEKDRSKLKSFLGDYVVREGDSLWKIAETFYKNGGHYVEIYNVNQDILKDPNKIFPGQRLRVPVLIDKGL